MCFLRTSKSSGIFSVKYDFSACTAQLHAHKG